MFGIEIHPIRELQRKCPGYISSVARFVPCLEKDIFQHDLLGGDFSKAEKFLSRVLCRSPGLKRVAPSLE